MRSFLERKIQLSPKERPKGRPLSSLEFMKAENRENGKGKGITEAL
jgi:hypothetical protein